MIEKLNNVWLPNKMDKAVYIFIKEEDTEMQGEVTPNYYLRFVDEKTRGTRIAHFILWDKFRKEIPVENEHGNYNYPNHFSPIGGGFFHLRTQEDGYRSKFKGPSVILTGSSGSFGKPDRVRLESFLDTLDMSKLDYPIEYYNPRNDPQYD